MKFAKLFFSVLLFLTFFVSGITESKNYLSQKKEDKKNFLVQVCSVYYEYQEINGIIWVIVYSDDGKEIDRFPLE